jgi:hypothetical protein
MAKGATVRRPAAKAAHSVVRVHASWDDEAQWWVAESDDVPGLATGAATWSALVAKLKVMVPELLELNAPGRALPDEIVVESAERIPVDA